MNTPISLLWRIQYEDCNNDGIGGCLQVFLNTSKNHGLYDFPAESNHIILKDLLFDAATTLISAGPNSTSVYANVRIIMFIDEFVRINVPFIHCKTVVSRGGQTFRNFTTVDIIFAEAHLPTTAVPSTTLVPTSTSKPSTCTQQCSSAHVVCSSEHILGLLCLIQLLYVIAS